MKFSVQAETETRHAAAERERKANLIEAAERGEPDECFELLRFAMVCTNRRGGDEATRLHYSEADALQKLVMRVTRAALEGHSAEAFALFQLAAHCTEHLHQVIAKAPAFLRDLGRIESVPVMVKRGEPGQWQSETKQQVAKFGVFLPMDGREARDGSHSGKRPARLKAFTDKLLLELQGKRRGLHPNGQDIVTKLLSKSPPKIQGPWVVQLQTLHNAKALTKDEMKTLVATLRMKLASRRAASFLPPPTLMNRDLWWRVAKVELQSHYGMEWYFHRTILQLAWHGKKKPAGQSQALASVGRALERSFFASMRDYDGGGTPDS